MTKIIAVLALAFLLTPLAATPPVDPDPFGKTLRCKPNDERPRCNRKVI
jgi:hypothetical protein